MKLYVYMFDEKEIIINGVEYDEKEKTYKIKNRDWNYDTVVNKNDLDIVKFNTYRFLMYSLANDKTKEYLEQISNKLNEKINYLQREIEKLNTEIETANTCEVKYDVPFKHFW